MDKKQIRVIGISVTHKELGYIIAGLDWFALECPSSWDNADIVDLETRLRTLYYDNMDESDRVKKYKILDQLAEEAEESRSDYRRWKNERDRTFKQSD